MSKSRCRQRGRLQEYSEAQSEQCIVQPNLHLRESRYLWNVTESHKCQLPVWDIGLQASSRSRAAQAGSSDFSEDDHLELQLTVVERCASGTEVMRVMSVSLLSVRRVTVIHRSVAGAARVLVSVVHGWNRV